MTDVQTQVSGENQAPGSTGQQQGSGSTQTQSTIMTPVISATDDQSWKTNLPKELLDDPTIKNVKTVADLAKMTIHSQSLIGKDKFVKPGDHATKEEWTKIDRILGVHEDPNKYVEAIHTPENFDKNSDYYKGFTKIAHELGIRPSQAEGLIKWNTELAKQITEAQDMSEKAKAAEEVKALQTEWGKAYDKNMELSRTGLASIMEKSEADKIISDPVLANNTTFIKLMHKIGNMVSEDKIKGDFVGHSDLLAPMDAQREINKIYGDKTHPYWNATHPEHKYALDQMSKLFEAKLSEAQTT